jgi:hypothetical protein
MHRIFRFLPSRPQFLDDLSTRPSDLPSYLPSYLLSYSPTYPPTYLPTYLQYIPHVVNTQRQRLRK